MNLVLKSNSMDNEKKQHTLDKSAPFGVQIKVKIPSQENQGYCNSEVTENSHYYVNQDLLKENLSLKKQLEFANAEIEKLKTELNKERNTKILNICKLCKEKGSKSFKFDNFDEYINKQISRIKKEYEDDLLFQKLELEAAYEANKNANPNDQHNNSGHLS